jgi:transposase
MGRPYSNDLRERVVRAVVKGGLSRHKAAGDQHSNSLGAALSQDGQR